MKKMTKLAACTAVAALTLAATLPQATAKPAHKTFEDYCRDESLPQDQKDFVKAVLRDMDTKDCAQPQRHVDEYHSLQIRSSFVTNIKPIEGFTGLKTVLLTRNKISDLSPLAVHKDLVTLWVTDNMVEDITPLAGLTQLTRLKLDGNRIQDITPIAGLKELIQLGIASNDITDFSALAGLTKLTWLSVGYPQSSKHERCVYPRPKTTGLSTSLKNLTKLKTLLANSLDIADSSIIAQMTELDTLRIDCNQLTDTAFLDTLPNLADAELSHNPFAKVTMTKLNKNFVWLIMRGVSLKDVSFLDRMPNLTYLDLSHNDILDAGPITDLFRLNDLVLTNNRIQDAGFAAGLSSLITLNLENNDIATFPFGRVGPELIRVNLNGNVLKHIKGIKDLPSLADLEIANNPIADISPMAELPPNQMLYLDISSTDITDLSPIAGSGIISLKLDDGNFSSIDQIPELPDLEILSMKNAGVTSIAGLAERFGDMPSLSFSHNPITDLSELRHHHSFIRLELAGVKVGSLEDLRHLDFVTYADFSGMGISSIEPLAKMDGLFELNLNDNSISDLSPLSKTAPKIESLGLANNKITSLAPIADKQFLRHVHRLSLDGNPLGTSTAKSPENCPTTAPSKAVRDWCRRP